ncbi:hypothetical protein ACH5RR_022148 [Cinchona calisaya]|uniref:Uncharacterized protein n=1 Tax=Cinchona calisaya TaxID=153742 RepID=A0ABD2Z8V6_9GENT
MSSPPPPPPPPQLLDPFGQQQQAYTAHSGHGSVGPVIAVLAVISILGAIAVMIGRLCSGRGIFGHGPHYDFERWVETKCSSCVDGRVESPAPRRMVTEHRRSSSSATSAAARGEVEEVGDQEMSHEVEEDQATSSSHPLPPHNS